MSEILTKDMEEKVQLEKESKEIKAKIAERETTISELEERAKIARGKSKEAKKGMQELISNISKGKEGTFPNKYYFRNREIEKGKY